MASLLFVISVITPLPSFPERAEVIKMFHV